MIYTLPLLIVGYGLIFSYIMKRYENSHRSVDEDKSKKIAGHFMFFWFVGCDIVFAWLWIYGKFDPSSFVSLMATIISTFSIMMIGLQIIVILSILSDKLEKLAKYMTKRD